MRRGGGGEVVGGAASRGVGFSAEEGPGVELVVHSCWLGRLGELLVHGLVLQGIEPASSLK